MNNNDTRRKGLQLLLDSETLWVMLSSKNLENVKLAAGLIENCDTDSELAMPVNELVMKLLKLISSMYEPSEILNRDQKSRIDAITTIEGAIISLSKKTWIDPIELHASISMAKRIAEIALQKTNDDVINRAL